MTNEERREIAEVMKRAKPEVLNEIMRQAESFLAEQLKSGLAADQRAMNMAVVLAAVLAAIAGGSASLLAAKIDLGWHFAGLGIVAVSISVALIFAVMAARPTLFYFAGTSPRRWIPDIEDGRDLHESIAGQAAIYAQGISKNSDCLAEGHRWLKIALRISTAGTLLFTFAEFVMALSGIAKNGLPFG